jgi:hypothetical protein
MYSEANTRFEHARKRDQNSRLHLKHVAQRRALFFARAGQGTEISPRIFTPRLKILGFVLRSGGRVEGFSLRTSSSCVCTCAVNLRSSQYVCEYTMCTCALCMVFVCIYRYIHTFSWHTGYNHSIFTCMCIPFEAICCAYITKNSWTH